MEVSYQLKKCHYRCKVPHVTDGMWVSISQPAPVPLCMHVLWAFGPSYLHPHSLSLFTSLYVLSSVLLSLTVQ